MAKGIYIALGANLGDREKNLLLGIKKINEQCGTVLTASSPYTTQAWGNTDQPEFLNQVIKISSSLKPANLLKALKSIETEMGRTATLRWGPRVIDLDILFYGEEIVNEDGLVIPHEGIALRRFVLVPLCEIAPEFRHPLLNKSIKELLEVCEDESEVKLYVPG